MLLTFDFFGVIILSVNGKSADTKKIKIGGKKMLSNLINSFIGGIGVLFIAIILPTAVALAIFKIVSSNKKNNGGAKK